MKKWLKRNGKWIIVGLGILFIANGIYGIIIADAAWQVMLYVIAITIWVPLLLMESGVFEKLFRWWEKD